LNENKGNKINCSLNEIKLNLGEITSYEYEKPITIKILSFIDEEVKASIIEQNINSNENNNDDGNDNSLNNSMEEIKVNIKGKYMYTKEKLKPKEDIEIYRKTHCPTSPVVQPP